MFMKNKIHFCDQNVNKIGTYRSKNKNPNQMGLVNVSYLVISDKWRHKNQESL